MTDNLTDANNSPQEEPINSNQVKAGRAGGLSRSEAKRAAVRVNLAKARLSRWPGREAAALNKLEAVNGQAKISKMASEDGRGVRFGDSITGGSAQGADCPTAPDADGTSEAGGSPAGGYPSDGVPESSK